MNMYSYNQMINYNYKEKRMKDIDICCSNDLHEDVVNSVRSKMPDTEMLYELGELFKVFGDTTRVRILYALSAQEMCVCDIAELLEMTHSSISHQLRVLKQARLVKFRKEGKSVFYSLDDCHISQIFSCGLEHIEEKYKK